VWHCFRCSSGGGPLSLIAVLEGFIPCEDATKGALRNAKYHQTLKAAVEKQLLDSVHLNFKDPSGAEYFSQFCDEEGKFIPKLLAQEIQRHCQFVTPGLRTDIYLYREDAGIWADDGEKIIRELSARLLGEKERINRIKEVIECIKNNTFIDRDKLGRSSVKVVVQNGVLNLETFELEPFDPELYALNALPITYDPEKKCPFIIKFLNEVAPKDLETLQEWIGYHLLKAYPYHKCLMLVGGGRNGKSTFLALLRTFLGEENVESLSLYLITSNINARTKLYGKLANISADISSDELKRTGDLKSLAGGDWLFARKLYQEGFDFLNYAKLSFAANQIPTSPDQSRAFFSRWLIIGFPNKFEGENCDPAILSKLTTDDELSGLLNWALRGLQRLVKNGDFTNSPTAEETQELYEQMSDPVTAFISNCLEPIHEGIETKDDLYNAYYLFCRTRRFSYVMKNILTKQLKPKVPEILGIALSETTRNKKTCWQGIQLLCEDCHMCQEAQPKQEKTTTTLFDVPPLCEECGDPISDDSNITWRDGRRVCRRCQMFLIKTYKETKEDG